MKSAFTLIEILIVVILLGILAAIVIPNFTGAGDEAAMNTCKSNQGTINTAAAVYRTAEGAFPADVAALVADGKLQSAPTCNGVAFTAINATGQTVCPNATATHVLP